MKQRTRTGSPPSNSGKNGKTFGSRPGTSARRDGGRAAPRDHAEGQSDRPSRSAKSFTPGKSFAKRGENRADKKFWHADKPRKSSGRDEAPREQKFAKAERNLYSGKPFGKREETRTEEKAWRPERTGNPFSRTGASTRRDKPRDNRAEEKSGRPDRAKGKFFKSHRDAAPGGNTNNSDVTRKFNKPFKKPFAKPASEQTTAKSAPREGILLWGMHAVREALLNPRRHCLGLWATDATHDAVAKLLVTARAAGLQRPDPVIADRDALNQMLPPSSVHQGIVLEVALLPEITLHEVIQAEPAPDLLIVLDQVTDPHNVGAILRSAAAFGAGAVVMTERNAPTTTGVMAKTASGAAEHVPQIHVVNLARALAELQQAGYWCVGLAEEGTRDLAALDLSGKTALVFGAEGDGLRRLTREKCDELARLPTSGAIGSLNVSNAAAVALYEVRRQKVKFT